jgi:predicted DCC family thiol-disulfide oxidoreductase YuxK
MTTASARRGTLVFDGGCGFCTRARDVLAKLDHQQRVRTEPFQRAGTGERTGLSRAELERSVWWLDSSGARPVSGAAAVNHALAAALGSDIPLRCYRIGLVGKAQEAVYRWIAVRRHRFPGTTPWCQRHPEDCAE